MATTKVNPCRFCYDFDICFGTEALKRALTTINYNGYELLAVTQTMDKYTVFFRRPVA